MHDDDLQERFESHRPRLRSIAHRILGSAAEAEDAIQDTWLRASRHGAKDVDNLGAWLTTIVSRVSLNHLRSRGRRREDLRMPEQFDGLPDPLVTPVRPLTPEEEVVLADGVGLAMLVVLDRLTPAQRVAFVLHDVFGYHHEEVASVLGRSPAATRQLASRARRLVADASPPDPNTTTAQHRQVVDAYLAAARDGDLTTLLEVLDPDVILRADLGADSRLSGLVRGATDVAAQAVRGVPPGSEVVDVLVDGRPGVVATVRGRPIAMLGFSVRSGRIVGIDVIGGHERVLSLAENVLPNR